MGLDEFLKAIVAEPHNAAATWLVLADWLEEQDDPRAELVRLLYQPGYRRDLPPEQRDERVRQLLASGVGPVAPTLINSIGMKLVLIPAGVFTMGSPEGEGDDDEHPQHEVEITRPFFLGAYPVTQEEYERVTGDNPSSFSPGRGSDRVQDLDTRRFPVETVLWEEATAFCAALANRPEEKAAGRRYRLPTEAEWEYACRGGAAAHVPFHFGNSLSSTQANFEGDPPHEPNPGRPTPVGSYPANAFGLFDMHGNVAEWCLDWFNEESYRAGVKKDPQGQPVGSRRVLRGGMWSLDARYCRSGCRDCLSPKVRNSSCGFRVCCLVDF